MFFTVLQAQDLVRFLLIFLIFILAYGVTSTSLLYPEGNHLQKFITLVLRPVFHVYGEYFIQIDEGGTCKSNFLCQNKK